LNGKDSFLIIVIKVSRLVYPENRVGVRTYIAKCGRSRIAHGEEKKKDV
jgi:hypothetical protein